MVGDLRLGDLDHLVELNGDPEVMRYLTGGKPSPRAFNAS